MASKTKLRKALRKARQNIVELLPSDSERKQLARVVELLDEEWLAVVNALHEYESSGGDYDRQDYGRLLGVQTIIHRVRECMAGRLES